MLLRDFGLCGPCRVEQCSVETMKKGFSMKRMRLKGTHQCCEKCTVAPDGTETHYEIFDGEEVCFKVKLATGLRESDPEMFKLVRDENVDKARQKAYAAHSDQRLAQEVVGYKNMKEAFEVFDADGSGYLDTEELMLILTRAGGGNPMTEDDAKSFITLFDHNGDGKMQYTEFIEAMQALAEASGLWEGQEDVAADEVVEALVEDFGLSMLTKMDEHQLEKLKAAKEKLRSAKGAGVGQKAELKAAAARKVAAPTTAARAECPISGLAELMADLEITDHLCAATEWCVEVGIDSLDELREIDMGEDLVEFLTDLKPAKATLMLRRIRAGDK